MSDINPFAFDPATIPPGPERRQQMRAHGWNISPADFTADELKQLDAGVAQSEAIPVGAGEHGTVVAGG